MKGFFMNYDVNETLALKAVQSMQNAYSPYSNFMVGSAILTKDGEIYSGCNIENASYGATICAERVALYKAVSAGEKDFVKLTIACNGDNFPYPCGICLQVLSEFCDDLEIDLINSRGIIKSVRLKELYPSAFKFDKK